MQTNEQAQNSMQANQEKARRIAMTSETFFTTNDVYCQQIDYCNLLSSLFSKIPQTNLLYL